jgi:four helix bundle protein
MEILEISKGFTKEEKYSLTDQIRRSSRAVFGCNCRILWKEKISKAFCK